MESLTALDGYPIAIRTAFLPADPFRRLVDDPMINRDRSPYELISEVLDAPVGDTDLEISCSNADGSCAAELRVPRGHALQDTSRVVRLSGGEPGWSSASVMRADRLSLTHLTRSAAVHTRMRTGIGGKTPARRSDR